MKKTLTILFAIVCAVLLASCTTDDSDDPWMGGFNGQIGRMSRAE